MVPWGAQRSKDGVTKARGADHRDELCLPSVPKGGLPTAHLIWSVHKIKKSLLESTEEEDLHPEMY